MPRTNQGVFKKIKNNFKSLDMEYNDAIKQYFRNGDWNNNYDFISDFAYTADSIYTNANNLSYEIGGMLNATKFESEDKKEKYQYLFFSAQQMADDIKNKFDVVHDIINKYGGGFSNKEQITLEGLSIYSKH